MRGAAQSIHPDHVADTDPGEAPATTWTPLLRELLQRRGLGYDDAADPRGLVLRGARIRGRLDLDLADCLLEHGATAQQAPLLLLSLVRCRLRHLALPALDAERLHLDGPLQLDGSVITTATAGGAVRLHGARVDGPLILSAATLRNSQGSALHADGLQTDGDVLLHGVFMQNSLLKLSLVCVVCQ